MKEESCLICCKRIKNWCDDSPAIEAPESAVSFKGCGGYGSKYDLLEMTILICDSCIGEYKDNIAKIISRDF